MKNTSVRTLRIGLCVLGLVVVSRAEANLCQALMAQGSQPFAAMDWRLFPNTSTSSAVMAGTNLNASGSVSRTTTKREREILSKAMSFERNILHQSSTPLMDFYPEAGTKMTYLQRTPGYESGVINSVKVSGLGADGVLRGTFVLPVSGHLGAESAMKWAKTDFYRIIMHDSSGKQTVLQRSQSKDITTLHEIEVPLVKDQEVTLYYDREGSAGPHGFIEGRALKVVWDGTVSARNSEPRFSINSPQILPTTRSLWNRLRDRLGL